MIDISMSRIKRISNTIINNIYDFHLMTSFDPIFELFLTFSKWRENPHSEGPQIFATLKSDEYFWRLLQPVLSLEHISASNCGIYTWIWDRKFERDIIYWAWVWYMMNKITKSNAFVYFDICMKVSIYYLQC